MHMKRLAAAMLMVAATPSLAAQKQQFWNETAHEMTGVYLAPAGTAAFGPNQALNDPDKSVSADERLALTGVTAGRYDVKLVDTKRADLPGAQRRGEGDRQGRVLGRREAADRLQVKRCL